MSKVKPYIVALATCLVAPTIHAADTSGNEPPGNVSILRPAHNTSFNQQVAVYEYQRGNQRDALLELAIGDSSLLAQTDDANRELVRMEQLYKALDSHLAGEMPVELNNKLWLDISELRRQNGDCEGALDALEELKELTMEMDHRERLQRVTCMLDQHSLSNAVLVAAENIALSAEGTSIWLAYIYNNIAVAAQYLENYPSAQEYFQKALLYTDDSVEGKALASHIQLSLSFSYYSAYRYDYAVKAFSEMRESSEWIDLALLGFGWSAYKNNQPGLALEAWRQLVRLPFKSISVYEGYIAIPFALEKQNAFSEAFAAYRSAIKEYEGVITEVDRLSAELSNEGLLKHALEYARSKDEEVNPLDPLLVYAFARESFQDVFDTIAKIDATRKHVAEMEYTLFVLEQARQTETAELSNIKSKRSQKEKQIEARIDQSLRGVADLSDAALDVAYSRLPADNSMKQQYQKYKKLLPKMTEEQKNRMKGVLIGELQEEDWLLTDEQQNIVDLTMAYHRMSTRYQKYQKLKGNMLRSSKIDEQIAEMRTKMDAAQEQLTKTETQAVELLMAKTQESLKQQRAQLALFQNQARIAATRLGEEFYQRGGRRLWD